MQMSHRKGILVALVTTAGAAGLAPLLLAQSGTTQPTKPQTKSAQQARLDAALKVIDIMTKMSPDACPEPELWHTWQYRWMESAIAVAPDAGARLKVLAEYRDKMKDLVARVEIAQVGRTRLELAEARYFLAEAEAMMTEPGR